MMDLQKKVRISNPILLAEMRRKPCAVSALFGHGDNIVVVHHMITVGSGHGHDLPWNLLPILLTLHSEIHNIGYTRMADKYPLFRKWLLDNEWTYDQARKKWRHGN